uniref:1-phosphatidylinositol-5-phosphate 4-kinase n=1 Tax=Meloidogyne floridensis TaxID=298350 RepID=A0A915P4V4_9BILA
MGHKSFGDRSSISLLENLDADKVLLQFGKCGSYQFGINCENKYLLDHASGAFMFGNLVASTLATYLADRYGRRMTFLLSLWFTTAMSFACAYSPTYSLFLVFRFLSGASGQAILIVGYVVTVESVATSFRSIQALINSLVWVLGIFVVGILYQFILNWRYLYLCVVFPGLFTLSYYWAFPESLHWLITNKETEKVQKYLNLSQYVNRTKVNLEECQNDSNQTNKIRVKRNFLDLSLFKYPTTFILSVVLNFVYWVLTLHSVDMHENRMVGFFLSAAVEIPAGIIAMLLLMIFGRRTVTFLSISGQTISLGLTIFTPRGTTTFLILSLIAKIMNTIAWASAPLLLSEMAPTTVRNMSYGLISTVGEIGSSLAPYLNRIEDENIQKAIIALMSVVAIIFSLMAPETFGKSLPQDLDDFDAGPFVGELMHVPPPALLMPDDFKAYSKVKVSNHSFNKDVMPSHFKFKDYCPNVFRNIREQFGVDQSEYLCSLTMQEPESKPNESSSSGRLFISYDKQFVIKVIDSEAIAEIHSILPKYHEYVVEQHGKTLLPQYLGLYRITVDVGETYMLVMRNIFGGKYNIHKKYDLKGSTVQRQASEKEKSKQLPTLKDNDFLEENYKLMLPGDAKSQLMKLLKSDTEFLTKMHLMDYSLLLGIHDIELEQQLQKERVASSSPVDEECPAGLVAELHQQQLSDLDSGGEQISPPESPIHSAGAFTTNSGGLNLDDEFFGIPSSEESPRKLVYFIGLVDILTYYGVKKRTESAAKTVKYGSGAENTSTVKPEQYAKRLLEFVNKNVSSPSRSHPVTFPRDTAPLESYPHPLSMDPIVSVTAEAGKMTSVTMSIDEKLATASIK